ncbi:MAG: type II toxin-antitoxin system RelB/DinJ family antitoxin [Micrococcales bacterium]|nr:type II toxin-antitoxin system RelB/DinJ family antitoxin [Micrococcales bacterium]MCL2668243.1 type II toxin-antitoxin system RelB/DinJ family antitoxin [Micrococcales bacterium]
MTTSTFSVRMDRDVKHQFDAFCTEVGMTASTAINMFARVVVRTQKLPFEVSAGTLTEQELVERARDFDAGRNIVTHDLIET